MPYSNRQMESTPFGVDALAARAIYPRIKLGRLRAPGNPPENWCSWIQPVTATAWLAYQLAL